MYKKIILISIYSNINSYLILEIILFIILFQQQQRPDLARLMQIHAQAQAGQLAPGPGPAGLPPGLLAGHPGAPTGLPTTMSLLAGIPTSATQNRFYSVASTICVKKVFEIMCLVKHPL